MPFFEKKKSPRDLIQGINENLNILSNSQNEKDQKNAINQIAKILSQIKEMLVDKSDSRITGKEKDQETANAERVRIKEIVQEITTEMNQLDLYLPLISKLGLLEFESMKQVVEIFGHVFRIQPDSLVAINSAVNHIKEKPEVLRALLNSYDKPDTIPHCGEIIRDACRHEVISLKVLNMPEFYKLFTHAQSTAFDISSDSFATIKELVTRHKKIVSNFIEENFTEFFHHYQNLYLSDNYMTQRQALKVLSEILLEGHNRNIMKMYISDPKNLKNIMNLLKDEKKQLAFEAFHCFKVFVATPDKPKPILTILFQNKVRLIEFLKQFQIDRTDDGQLQIEKEYVIHQIAELTMPTETTASDKPVPSSNIAKSSDSELTSKH